MCSKRGSDQAKGNQGLWVKKEKESPHTAYFCIILLFCSTHFVSRVSLWLWKRRRKSFLNNNIHLPWERWSRRLSKKLSYFIALRHYSFPWHIMFLIKIACELIKIFTRALFPPASCMGSLLLLKLFGKTQFHFNFAAFIGYSFSRESIYKVNWKKSNLQNSLWSGQGKGKWPEVELLWLRHFFLLT